MTIHFSYKFLLIIVFIVPQLSAQKPEKVTCTSRRRSRCFLKSITCPSQCPFTSPKDPNAKACFINCDSPICKAECRHRKPSCKGIGAACYDPRFIGADGVVFYFHGKSNEHFALVSDTNLQINAQFIGHRPAGRTRDYTWIRALGILFKSHKLSIEAAKAAKWDNNIDHLNISFNGDEVVLPQDALSSDDCFSHLEVQFRFFDLSPVVEGVLGRTYRPDYESEARLGVAMPVVGGDDKYRTTSLFAADCKKCVFSSNVL